MSAKDSNPGKFKKRLASEDVRPVEVLSDSPESLTGSVKRIIFRNNDNNFTVFHIVSGGNSFTASGIFHDNPVIGLKVTLTGKFTFHKKFGYQFNFENYEISLTTEKSSVVEYLSSNIFKGIGKSLAAEIYEVFREDTINVIDNDPERLREVKGIGDAKYGNIIRGLKESRGFRRAVMFFKPYFFSDYQIRAIYNEFEEKSIEIAENNPYMFTDIKGIGFKKADIMAGKLGISKDDPNRIKEAVRYVVKTMCENSGNSYVYYNDIKEGIGGILDDFEYFSKIGVNDLRKIIEELKTEKKLIIEPDEDLKTDKIYAPVYYFGEIGTAKELKRISGFQEPVRKKISKDKPPSFPSFLTEEQKNAVMNALNQKISIISGGPGTGKSTIIKTIVELFDGSDIALCSLSGKAAQRLADILGLPGDQKNGLAKVSTIHRLLKAKFDRTKNEVFFAFNENNKLPYDLIVIDEMSMVDVIIFHRLLKAVKDDAVLVLVGDVNQIPSVAPGDVLRDLIYSDRKDPLNVRPVFPLTFLTRVFRQDEGGLININAGNVLRNKRFIFKKKDITGKINKASEFTVRYRKEYDFKETGKTLLLDDFINFLKKIKEKRLDGMEGVDAVRLIKDIQVLTPMKKGELGYFNINRIMQDIFNPAIPGSSGYFDCNGLQFRLNDRVIQRKNNYDLDVFNGDGGTIYSISQNDKTVEVDFGNSAAPGLDGPRKLVKYDFIDVFDNITLAYALSIHKAQGSEFDNVIILFHQSHYIMLKKNLLYTAITRGKKNVVIFGTYKAFGIALGSREDIRNSGLKDRCCQL